MKQRNLSSEGRQPHGRVLVVNPSPWLYGADRQLLEALRVLSCRGVAVTVVFSGRGLGGGSSAFSSAVERLDIPVVEFRFPILQKAILHSWRGFAQFVFGHIAMVEMRSLLTSEDWDCVFVNTTTIPLWILLAKLSRIPAICYVHEAEAQMSGFIRRALSSPLYFCDRVIANSVFTGQLLTTDHPGLTSRVKVVENGIRIAGGVKPLPTERPATLSVLFVGRLARRKGLLPLIASVRRLVSNNVPVRLHLVGDGVPGDDFEQVLRLRISDLELDGMVSFCGYVREIYGPIDSSHVLVLPSVMESFGNVAIEAMARARPVVVSKVGGLKDIPIDGESGYVVDPTENGIYSALMRIWSDWDTTKEMSHAARERSLHFSYEKYEARFWAAVEPLLA